MAVVMARVVVLTRAPVWQAMVLSGYGLPLGVLFVVLEAPRGGAVTDRRRHRGHFPAGAAGREGATEQQLVDRKASVWPSSRGRAEPWLIDLLSGMRLTIP
ncbi:hypothetical protein ABZ801_22235 [Actinomadura sp. NPDC047616]|uniref:hypothetical protein n=1 Tax=Actinomadura sp. NPDC047616 TaxID=3155914 RepID=UPI0034117BF6